MDMQVNGIQLYGNNPRGQVRPPYWGRGSCGPGRWAGTLAPPLSSVPPLSPAPLPPPLPPPARRLATATGVTSGHLNSASAGRTRGWRRPSPGARGSQRRRARPRASGRPPLPPRRRRSSGARRAGAAGTRRAWGCSPPSSCRCCRRRRTACWTSRR